jgi:hypothetical protein
MIINNDSGCEALIFYCSEILAGFEGSEENKKVFIE